MCVAGLPMYHWADGDSAAEAYAMVSLVQCGYAEQKEVARAFGHSTRTLRRCQRRYEAEGMSSLGRRSGRPAGSRGAPGPWVQTAAVLQSKGLGVRAIALRVGVSTGTVSTWLRWPEGSGISPAPGTGQGAGASTAVEVAVESKAGRSIRGKSLDTNPLNRTIDRLLARLGLLEDAEPVFKPGKCVPRAGVLLAVPALVQSGIFTVAQEVYGHIGPAFYGLRTTVLALLVMALLRVKRPEGLKEHVPGDMGRLLGLDRAPEVKTLRRKLSRLASCGRAEEFGRKLAQRRVARRGRMLGFLYVDGHVRIYHGRRRIPKAYATRLRLALPATTDYWVNDKRGDPVFVVTAEANAALVTMLPAITQEIRSLVGRKRRVTVVFDRGGWSPKLFAKLIRRGFDILTYRKGQWKKVPRGRFRTVEKRIEGRRVSYELNERTIRLLKGRLRLRQITRLCARDHQTPVVTSRFDLTAVELAYRMFERWRQENFLKYLREEYALDALVDYRTEPDRPERLVPNPERRTIRKELTTARAKLKTLEALYGGAVMDNKERKRSTVRGFKIAHGKLGQEIRAVRTRIGLLEARLKQTPKRVMVEDLSGEPLVRLAQERKHLSDCIKMVAYQAESDLLALVRPHYARADQEGRTLVSSALHNPADVDVTGKELRVTLAPLSSQHRTRAIASLCRVLGGMDCCFPGTELLMRFAVAQRGS